jgi:hypothetical protein
VPPDPTGPIRSAFEDATEVADLFLRLYRVAVHRDFHDPIIVVFTDGGWASQRAFSGWRSGRQTGAVAIREAARSIPPSAWQHDFDAARREMVRTFFEVLGSLSTEEERLAAMVVLLRELDRVVGDVLSASSTPTWPSPPGSDWTVVGCNKRFFDSDLPSPKEDLRFVEALALDHVRLVHSVPGWDWSLQRLPWELDELMADATANSPNGPSPSIVLFSPWLDNVLDTVDVDENVMTFRMNPRPLDVATYDALCHVLDAPATVVMLPELTYSTDLAARLSAKLRCGSGIGLVLAGSEHEMQGNATFRNRCHAIEGDGRFAPHLVHDKTCPFPLPLALSRKLATERKLPRALQRIDRGRTFVEGIAPSSRCTLFESNTLGRFVIGICRDFLDSPNFVAMCQQLAPDHVFVPAMSQSLTLFHQGCRALGGDIGAAIYVVNARTHAGTEAGSVYIPRRGSGWPKVLEVTPGLDEKAPFAWRVTLGDPPVVTAI